MGGGAAFLRLCGLRAVKERELAAESDAVSGRDLMWDACVFIGANGGSDPWQMAG
jgi:UPF0716 family protein affecting phage T7 exclusion